MNQRFRSTPLWKRHILSVMVSTIFMTIAVTASFLYHNIVPEQTTNIALIFILALVLISRWTVGYLYGTICSLIAVIFINYVFTYPYFEINFTLSGYPITFIVMLGISLLTSTMTSHLTLQSEMIAEREKQLAEAEMEKMRANLLRAISHDLRTPLTGIIGNSSLFLENQERLNSDEQKEIVTNIYNDSNWLLNMVENLLTITRIQGDNFSIKTTEESVEEVIAAALQKINKRYPDTIIEVQIPDEFILLPMDAILVEQVTVNLLENAIVHSGSTRPLELLVENHPHHVSFTIKDYGNGISSERLENLFDGTSYTPSQTSDARKGMGIGLSICKTIITAHHGTIIGQNHAQGAEFIFTIPKKH